MSRLRSSESNSPALIRRRALLHVADGRLLSALTGALVSDGWCVEAACGRRALGLLAERWPDVVVGDTGLADVDPLRVLLDAARRGVPVALCVRAVEAKALDPDLRTALGRHAIICLPAPIAELRDRVTGLLPFARPAILEESTVPSVSHSAARRPAALEALS